jgi:outer membrane protein OmpA-like peptidoglycan-associated protein/ABC-type taurine transport system substrate-binding protein
MNRHVIGFMALLVVGATILVGGYYFLPSWFDNVMRSTSDAGSAGQTLRIGVDNWVGYVPLCSKELRKRMHDAGYLVQCNDDSADYAARMQRLRAGELDFAVATVDSFLLNGAKEKFPGTIILVIDESSGGDAIVARKDRLASLDDLKTKTGYKIAYTPGSPSEHLLKAVAVHFDVPPLRDRQGAWRVPVNGSPEAWKRLQAGSVDAAVLWEPDVTRALASGMHRILGTENTRRLIVDVLLVGREFSQRQPEAAKILLAHYFRTLRHFRDNPAALTDEVKDSTRMNEQQIGAMLKGVRWATLTENAHDWFGVGAGGKRSGTEGLINTLESSAQILVDNGDFRDSPIPGRDPYRLQLRTFVEELYTTGLDGAFGAAAGEAARRFDTLTEQQWDTLAEVGTLKIRPITFQSGTSELTHEGKLQLDVAAANLSHYPNFRVVVRGHTGTRGERASNRELSLARAEAVRRYLTAGQGVEENRIRAVGFGGERPLAREPGEADRAYEYRLPRVELYLVSETY